MTGNSFTQKILQANLTLVGGKTFDGKNNTKIVSGLRMECDVEKTGSPAKNGCKLKIYGMLENDMTSFTTLPGTADKPLAVRQNLMQILAGDVSGMATVFQGEITEAWTDFHAQPNLYFRIAGVAGYYPSIAPVQPRSYKGSVKVSTLMSALAQQMGYAFQDAGVTASLKCPYLHGTAMQQVQAIAAASNIEYGVDDNVLFIAPRGQPRPGTAPLISPQTGLHGYPTFDKKGIKFKCMFNPNLQQGGLCVVQSQIQVCCGTWRIISLKHHLSCLLPNGKWHSEVEASYVGS